MLVTTLGCIFDYEHTYCTYAVVSGASERAPLPAPNQPAPFSLARSHWSVSSIMVSLSENTSGKHRRHAAAQAAIATAATCTCTATTIAAPEAPQSPFPLRTDG